MNKLKAKLKKEGGFTLIEMLIVVAIIAILVAISIPLINSTLEKARDATDQANERAAKAEAMLYFMGVVSDTELAALGNYVPGAALTAYYDADKGSLKVDKTDITGYGKCKGKTGCYQNSTPMTDHTNQVIKIVVDTGGVATITWEAKS